MRSWVIWITMHNGLQSTLHTNIDIVKNHFYCAESVLKRTEEMF